MKRRGKDWMTGDMVAPIVKRHSPRIRAVVSAEAGQPLCSWLEAEPAAVLLPDRAVRRLDLGVMKDRLAKDEITARRPGDVVQRVMRVFRAEAGQNSAT